MGKHGLVWNVASRILRVVPFLLGVTAIAQDSNNLSPAPSTSESTREMQTVVVSAVAPEKQIVPTARPISSVFGQDMNVVDVPRSVSEITRQQLEDRQLFSVEQLGQYSSGTYTPGEYGLAGIPFIRGVFGELYQNGQRLLFLTNTVTPSFNQVGSLDIVKGPGSTVYGPSNEGLGGYVNFITKSPEFDGFHTEIESTAGAYAADGHSYSNYEWTIDSTGPLIKDKLAYRFSYEGREGDGYYRNTKDDKQDFFLGLTWLPTDALKFEFTAQGYETRSNQALGFNRVTQQLIDNNLYVAGPQSKPYGVVIPTGTTHLAAYDSLNGPGNSAYGQNYIFQLVTTLTLNPDLWIVNYQLFQHLEARKMETRGYDEYLPFDNLYDTRTEVHLNYDTKIFGFSMKNQDIFGFSFRGQQAKEFSDFSNEPFAGYDLTRDPNTFDYAANGYATPNTGRFGGYNIKGMPGYSASLTAGDTGQYELYDLGIFYQHQTDWTKLFTTILGVRGDFIDGSTRIPTGDLIGYTGGAHASGTRVFNNSEFASGIFKLTDSVSVYVTYDRTTGVQGDANFGGLAVTDSKGNNSVTPAKLRNLSELYETGFKASLFKQTLFFSVAGFYQTRVQYSQFNDPQPIESRGVEVDAIYQPDSHLGITANFTWMKANYSGVSPYEQTGNYLDTFPTYYMVDGHYGTGVGSPNYHSYPKGDYYVPGIPKVYFNAYLTYKFDNGFGFGVGPQVTGEQNANVTGTLKIPAQVTWNANIFYRKPKWELQLNLFNFTNERNFTSVNASYTGNDMILEEKPFYITGSVKLRF
jgi:hypothetical protein